MTFIHSTPKNIERIAKNIYDWRMKMGETWGTAEGDYKRAKELCAKWDTERLTNGNG